MAFFNPPSGSVVGSLVEKNPYSIVGAFFLTRLNIIILLHFELNRNDSGVALFEWDIEHKCVQMNVVTGAKQQSSLLGRCSCLFSASMGNVVIFRLALPISGIDHQKRGGISDVGTDMDHLLQSPSSKSSLFSSRPHW